MKKIFSLLVLLIFTTVTHAKYGIGISIKEYDMSIFVPIQMNNNLIFEPFISYYDRESKDIEKSSGNTDTDGYKEETIGFGIIKIKEAKHNINIYSGIRFAYIEEGFYYSSNNSSSREDLPHSGYRIEPLIGLEYPLTENFKLAFEANLRYQKTDRNIDRAFNGNQEFTYEVNKETSTHSRFIARYFF